MKEKLTALATVVGVLIAVYVANSVYNSPKNHVLRMLGGRQRVRIVSDPDNAELFETPIYLSALTNGPQPDSIKKVEPGITLSRAKFDAIKTIIFDPESYLEDQERWQDTGSAPPEIIITLTQNGRSLDLWFGARLHELTLTDGVTWKKLRCDPACHRLKEALAPLLSSPDLNSAQ